MNKYVHTRETELHSKDFIFIFFPLQWLTFEQVTKMSLVLPYRNEQSYKMPPKFYNVTKCQQGTLVNPMKWRLLMAVCLIPCSSKQVKAPADNPSSRASSTHSKIVSLIAKNLCMNEKEYQLHTRKRELMREHSVRNS